MEPGCIEFEAGTEKNEAAVTKYRQSTRGFEGRPHWTDFVRPMLEHDPAKRPTVHEILDHAYARMYRLDTWSRSARASGRRSMEGIDPSSRPPSRNASYF